MLLSQFPQGVNKMNEMYALNHFCYPAFNNVDKAITYMHKTNFLKEIIVYDIDDGLKT